MSQLTQRLDRLLEAQPAYLAEPRLIELSLPKRPAQLAKPADIYAFVREGLEALPQEHGVALCLDTKLRVLHTEVVTKGTLNCAVVTARDVFRVAIRANAANVVFCHNHPSGDPEPSSEDLTVTHDLYLSGRIVGIPLLDHLIVGREGFVSLKEKRPHLFSMPQPVAPKRRTR